MLEEFLFNQHTANPARQEGSPIPGAPHCSALRARMTRAAIVPAASPSQLLFWPMNLLLRASFLINSISQAARARGTLLSDSPTKPEHTPVCSLRTEAGDGEGGGWDLKMNVQPRAQQASLGEGRAARAHCLPASRPAGLSAASRV